MAGILEEQLIKAVKTDKSYQRVLLCLKKGASPDATLGPTGLYRTALHYAVMDGNIDIVALLLEKGANPDLVDEEDMGPLHYAIAEKRFDIADLLLSCGADINLQAGASREKLNSAPLHTAVYCDNVSKGVERVDYLLQRGADMSRRNYLEFTPAMLADHINATDVLHRILENDRWVELEKTRKGNLAAAAVKKGAPETEALPKINIRQRKGFRP